MTPTFQGKLGVIYLDRNQVKILPAVGFTWTPNATSRYDVFFPAPRAMWRFGQTRRHAWWGYVAGEYGGGALDISHCELVMEQMGFIQRL